MIKVTPKKLKEYCNELRELGHDIEPHEMLKILQYQDSDYNRTCSVSESEKEYLKLIQSLNLKPNHH